MITKPDLIFFEYPEKFLDSLDYKSHNELQSLTNFVCRLLLEKKTVILRELLKPEGAFVS